MPDKRELVDSWLDDVLDSQRLTLNVTCIPQSFNLSSPPPSIRPGRKREHYARSDPCNGSIMSSPRKRTRTEDDQLTTTVASALDSIQLPSTVPSRSSSPTKIKATSPVRELRSIYRFATPPLKFTTSIDENTPQSIVDMICGLPVYGDGVIPSSLKETIRATLPFEDIPDCAFYASTSSDHDQNLWRAAVNTLHKSKSCFINNEPEAPWLAIANNLLGEIFAEPELKGMLCIKDIQCSDINSATLLPHVGGTAIPSKKADLAIAISSDTPVTAPVYNALLAFDPTVRLSQMSEPSVSRLALPGCVEVGEPGKNYFEASLQLGVWCFAGLAKLEELRAQSRTAGRKTLASTVGRQISITDSEGHATEDEMGVHTTAMNYPRAEQNIPVFGWTAIGMDWKLHIAYRDTTNGGVTVLGPLNSGGSSSAVELYKLIKTATVMAKWVKEKYWLEIRSIAEAQSG